MVVQFYALFFLMPITNMNEASVQAYSGNSFLCVVPLIFEGISRFSMFILKRIMEGKMFFQDKWENLYIFFHRNNRQSSVSFSAVLIPKEYNILHHVHQGFPIPGPLTDHGLFRTRLQKRQAGVHAKLYSHKQPASPLPPQPGHQATCSRCPNAEW